MTDGNVNEAANSRTAQAQPGSGAASGSAHVIAGKRLGCLIANCHRMMRHRYRKTPLWAMVSDITSHGSTYSVEICLQAGYDPNQNCGAAKLKASAPKTTEMRDPAPQDAWIATWTRWPGSLHRIVRCNL